jgi:hypothetical protein
LLGRSRGFQFPLALLLTSTCFEGFPDQFIP